MNERPRIEIPLRSIEARLQPGLRPAQPRLPMNLHVELRAHSPGINRLTPLPHHLLKMHVGRPVSGICNGGHRFHYQRGDLDVLPAESTSLWENETSSTALAVLLSRPLLHRAADELGLGTDSTELELRHQFRDSQIEHLAWALEAECRMGFPNGSLYTDCLGLALAIRLLRRGSAPPAMQSGLSKAHLQRITGHIETHLDQHLSIAELADLVGLSDSHFRTLFKRSTGLPVYEYVIRRRVERAKTLLLTGKLPASRVALDSGFAHQSHMARCMRRVLGVTPTALVRSDEGIDA